MKRTFSGKRVTGATLALLVFSMLTQPFIGEPVRSLPTTIIVPDDYSSARAKFCNAT